MFHELALKYIPFYVLLNKSLFPICYKHPLHQEIEKYNDNFIDLFLFLRINIFYHQNPDKIKLSVAATISISLVSSVPFNAKIHPRTSFTTRGRGVASFKTALPQSNIVFQNPYLA